MEISPKEFALICYNILMANGNGYIDKAPSYMREKAIIIQLGFAAFQYLDDNNQRKAIDFLRHWKYEIPREIKNYCSYSLLKCLELENPKK